MHRRAVESIVVLAATTLVAATLIARSAPALRWTRTVGHAETDVAFTRHGAMVVSGTTWKRDAGGRWWASAIVQVLGPSGGERWARAWRPPRGHAFGVSVAVAPDGSFYLAGELRPVEGMCDGWFLRAYGHRGGLRWHREQRGARACETASSPRSVDANARLVVLGGGDWADGWGTTDGWVRAYSPRGALLWTRTLTVRGYGPDPYTSAGDVALDAFDRVYLAGSVGVHDPNHPDLDAVVQKLSPSGAVVWTHPFADGHPAKVDLDGLGSVGVSRSSLLVAGWSDRRGWAQPDCWVARLGFGGRRSWTTHFAPGEPDLLVAASGRRAVVAQIGAGRVIVVTRLDPRGRRTWRTSVSGPEGRFEPSGLALEDVVAVTGWHRAARERAGTGRVWLLGGA
jgi:hypothetical protein